MKLKPLTCKETSELVSQGMDRKLSLNERFFVRLHLIYCIGCQIYKRQLSLIRQYLKKPPIPQPLSNHAKEVIQEKINQMMASDMSQNP